MYRFPSVSGGECKSVSIHQPLFGNYTSAIHQFALLGDFFPDTSCIIHRIFDVYLHSPPDAMLDAGAGDTSLYISYTAIQSIQRYMAIQCIGCITPPLNPEPHASIHDWGGTAIAQIAHGRSHVSVTECSAGAGE